jgi:hypothetical protein
MLILPISLIGISTDKALQSLQPTQRKTITQLIHEWLPVNGQMLRQQHKDNQKCPLCKTQHHFLTCPKSKEKWKEALNAAGIRQTSQPNIIMNTNEYLFSIYSIQH